MALAARRLFGCELGLAVTGVAGPQRQDGQEVGTAFVGVAVDGRGVVSRRLALGGSPEEIRELAMRHVVLAALEVL